MHSVLQTYGQFCEVVGF